MPKIVLGIHGLANKPPRDVLADGWMKAIYEGLRINAGITEEPPIDFRLVYWADLLYKYPKHDDELLSFDSLYDPEPYLPAEPGTLRRRGETLLDSIRASILDIGGSAIDAARRKIGHDELAEWLLSKVARDLAFYYDKDRRLRDAEKEVRPAREAIESVLRAALLAAHRDAAGDEILLVSHSMGTIVAYNVLRDLGQSHPEIDVACFVTLGSPLGLPYVRTQITLERTYDPTVRTPTLVSKRWLNYADPKDPVSADIRLHDDYQANARGVRVHDDYVYNDYRTHTERDGKREVKRNHHKIYGYLRTPEISDLFKEFLGV